MLCLCNVVKSKFIYVIVKVSEERKKETIIIL